MSAASAQPAVLPASTRVLFTNNTISGWTGSELYVRDVALELAQRGYLPVVHVRSWARSPTNCARPRSR